MYAVPAGNVLGTARAWQYVKYLLREIIFRFSFFSDYFFSGLFCENFFSFFLKEGSKESDDDDDDDDDGNDGGVNEEEDGDAGVGWKRAKTKKEKKKTDGNNRGRVNVDREEVEVETVVDASLFREQILSPLNSSPPPSRLVSTIEEEENDDENRLRRVANTSSNDNNGLRRSYIILLEITSLATQAECTILPHSTEYLNIDTIDTKRLHLDNGSQFDLHNK